MKQISYSRAVRFISSLLYFFSIFLFINAFNFQHNPPSGWENQFLPNLNGRIISDMEFTDSLNGYACAEAQEINIPSYLLRTTNGGKNWQITDSLYSNLLEIQFLNGHIGYVCGARMYKTTNSGTSWIQMNLPGEAGAIDMSVINEDTIWITDVEALTGGIFLTTNGGASWTRKYYAGGSENPEKIYFVNSRLGFASKTVLLRTSDGGDSWINYNPEIGFIDINFADTILGYKSSNGKVLKTTDGGINWRVLPTPEKNDTISENGVLRISSLLPNKNMYAVGAEAFIGSVRRKGIIFKSIDAGETWGYQLPDTNIIKFRYYSFIDFQDDNTGWAYRTNSGGIYTRSGGDTTIYTVIREVTSVIPLNFVLHQNFPNPFNPTTTIKFELKSNSQTDISVYDVSGRLTAVLVSEELRAGVYETVFDGSALSSGIYFCVMQSGSYRESITMALLK